MDRYDEEIAFCDSSFGELINKLKQLNLYDQSLIVVLCDRGQLFGEHNIFGHRSVLYEEVLKIPLVIKFPKGYQPVIDPHLPMENRQLFHLILDLLKIPSLHSTRAFFSDDQGVRYTLAEAFVPSSLTPIMSFSPGSRCFQEDFLGPRLAIIWHTDPHLKLIISAKGKDELYFLAEDPQEKINQIDNFQEMAAQLRRTWFAWQSLLQRDILLRGEEDGAPNKDLLDRLAHSAISIEFL